MHWWRVEGWLAVDVVLLLALTTAGAAQVGSAAPTLGTNGKPLEFDVVSIREDKSIPDPQKNPPEFGTTPDGYRLKGLPVIFAVSAAYIPSQGGDSVVFGPDRIVGPPGWLNTHYDIDAKVSEADLPRWKDPALQRTMFRTMLQAMLSERFKIAVHREYQDRPIFELTHAKGGPKLKPAEPTAIADFQQKHPAVQVHADIGGTVIAYAPDQMVFFNVTIPAFCANLSNHAGRPVNDKTGLTGKYDITLRTEPPPPPGGRGDRGPIGGLFQRTEPAGPQAGIAEEPCGDSGHRSHRDVFGELAAVELP